MTETVHIATGPHRMACGAEQGLAVFAFDRRATCPQCIARAREERPPSLHWPPPFADAGASLSIVQTGRWSWCGEVIWDIGAESYVAPRFVAFTRKGVRRKMLRWVMAHKQDDDVVIWRDV